MCVYGHGVLLSFFSHLLSSFGLQSRTPAKEREEVLDNPHYQAGPDRRVLYLPR